MSCEAGQTEIILGRINIVLIIFLFLLLLLLLLLIRSLSCRLLTLLIDGCCKLIQVLLLLLFLKCLLKVSQIGSEIILTKDLVEPENQREKVEEADHKEE